MRKALPVIVIFLVIIVHFSVASAAEGSSNNFILVPQRDGLLQADPCEGLSPDDVRSGMLYALECRVKCASAGIDINSVSDEELWACINNTGGVQPEPPIPVQPTPTRYVPEEPTPTPEYDNPCTGLDYNDFSWTGSARENPIWIACVNKCSQGNPDLQGRDPSTWMQVESLDCVCRYSEPAPAYCSDDFDPETDWDTLWADKLSRLIRNPLIVAVGAAGGAAAAGLIGFLQSIFSPGGSSGPPSNPFTPSGPPKIGDVNSKGEVWYRPPWDKGGPYWVDRATYNDIKSKLRKGMIWSDRWHWVTPKDALEREANRKRFLEADARDRAKFHESIRREQQALRAKQKADLEKKLQIRSMREKLEDLEWQRQRDNRDAAWNSPGVLREAGKMTSREIFTGQNADGGTSFKSMTVRLLSGILTGGQSEYVFNTADGAYRVNDKLGQGQSLSSALFDTAKEMIVEEAVGRGIAAGAGNGLSLAKKGIRGAKGVAEEIPLGGGKPKGDVPGGGPDAGDAVKVMDEPLPRNLQRKKDAMDKALSIADPEERAEAISRLYRQGGMDELTELERRGIIKPGQAKELNEVVTDRVTRSVDEGVKETINEFQDKTGVKVKEVMVGDSGSSARAGRARSVNTDADRTSLVTFDEKSLQEYADKFHGGDTTKAYNSLSKRFADAQDQFVDDSLRRNGLSAHDVDYKTYDRFGKPGPSDSYPDGFVRTTQATQGKTTVYKPNADGDIRSYQTSGQAMTDQDALVKKTLDGGNTPVEPAPKITPEDAAKLIDQQVKAVSNPNISPEKAAKALLRADKGASVSGLGRLNPDLVEMAEMWRQFPQEMAEKMGPEGKREFVKMVQEAVTNLGK